jgi:hypothetical protein
MLLLHLSTAVAEAFATLVEGAITEANANSTTTSKAFAGIMPTPTQRALKGMITTASTKTLTELLAVSLLGRGDFDRMPDALDAAKDIADGERPSVIDQLLDHGLVQNLRAGLTKINAA